MNSENQCKNYKLTVMDMNQVQNILYEIMNCKEQAVRFLISSFSIQSTMFKFAFIALAGVLHPKIKSTSQLSQVTGSAFVTTIMNQFFPFKHVTILLTGVSFSQD